MMEKPNESMAKANSPKYYPIRPKIPQQHYHGTYMSPLTAKYHQTTSQQTKLQTHEITTFLDIVRHSSFIEKARRFGDWNLFLWSGKTYSVGPNS
jgi:hypothetical protein